jgi:hypothetical protein
MTHESTYIEINISSGLLMRPQKGDRRAGFSLRASSRRALPMQSVHENVQIRRV